MIKSSGVSQGNKIVNVDQKNTYLPSTYHLLGTAGVDKWQLGLPVVYFDLPPISAIPANFIRLDNLSSVPPT